MAGLGPAALVGINMVGSLKAGKAWYGGLLERKEPLSARLEGLDTTNKHDAVTDAADSKREIICPFLSRCCVPAALHC